VRTRSPTLAWFEGTVEHHAETANAVAQRALALVKSLPSSAREHLKPLDHPEFEEGTENAKEGLNKTKTGASFGSLRGVMA
jgi:hypothetical protein